jgi:muconolactone D-isomerase
VFDGVDEILVKGMPRHALPRADGRPHPRDLDSEARAEFVAREKNYCQKLQRDGKWRHIWRIVGEYANFSIFDVESNDEMHTLLSELPLFPYLDIHVTPLATHPSDPKE